MYKPFYKSLVVTFLVLTGLMQGWPLLVTATCSMPAPQMMSQNGDCCCCNNPQNSRSPAFLSCDPGKRLVGILATDLSLLPGNDKTGKSLLQPLTVESVINLPAPFVSSLRRGFDDNESILPHTIATPLYLFDRTFRI